MTWKEKMSPARIKRPARFKSLLNIKTTLRFKTKMCADCLYVFDALNLLKRSGNL